MSRTLPRVLSHSYLLRGMTGKRSGEERARQVQFVRHFGAVNMANLVAFLRENGDKGVEMLEKQFAIHHTRHKKRPSLILFKYDQLNSPMSHPIVQECRGIILDESNDWKIVVFPYMKFFNMKESANAAEIDWNLPVRAYEKIDGSLLTMYYSQGEWHVATSGVPDASGTLHWRNQQKALETDEADDGEGETAEEAEKDKVDEAVDEEIAKAVLECGLTPLGVEGARKTNADLFWEVFKMHNYKLPKGPEDENKCYMFELATPQNVVLIRHTKASLYLHGVRDLATLQEELPDIYVERYGWHLTPMRVITGGKAQFEKEVLADVNSLDGLKCEGYVICDAHFNRFKLKCTSYVNLALLHNKDGKEWRRLVAIIQVNEGSEFLAYFPQYTELYNSLSERYAIVLDTLKKAEERFARLDARQLSAISKFIPDWVKNPIFITRKSGEDFKKFFSSPLRHGMLCGILDPHNKSFAVPDINAIDIDNIQLETKKKEKKEKKKPEESDNDAKEGDASSS